MKDRRERIKERRQKEPKKPRKKEKRLLKKDRRKFNILEIQQYKRTMVKHIIQALVENKFGVLARVASLFSARGYNISSLSVGETQDATISCMTIVVNAEDERILEQIKKQLHKLIDVITVIDFTRGNYIDRELLLVKAVKTKDLKSALDKLINAYDLKLTEETSGYYIIEVCAEHLKVEEALKELKKFDIRELVRTGRIAISK